MNFLGLTLLLLGCANFALAQPGNPLIDFFGQLTDNLIQFLQETGIGTIPLETFDYILLNVVPTFFGQKPFDADGRFEQYRDYLLNDDSNDDIALASVEEIVRRSGFEVKTYQVISADGYVTYLYNLINPLADRTKLKQPPVMIFHGGLTDPSIYVWASAIQHHPEKYPRTAADGPITSSNRSLAFVLCNNGYDVWLIPYRGCNSQNQGKLVPNGEDGTIIQNKPPGYWRFNFDNLIQDEAPKQLEKVLEVTGAKNVSLFGYSYSGLISLSLFGSRPDISKSKIHNYVVMAPFQQIESSNTFLKAVAEISRQLPLELGTTVLTDGLTSQTSRDLQVKLAQSKEVRYSIFKFLYGIFFGSSGKYRTNLELPVVGHLFQPTSFEQVKHAFQISKAKQFQMYDYGPKENLARYGRARPPVYSISNIHVKNWMLVSSPNDNLSPVSNIDQILRQVHPKPLKHLTITGYSHLDFVTAVDNDVQMTLPVLEFFDRFHF